MPLVSDEEYNILKGRTGWRWEVFQALLKAGPGHKYIVECSSRAGGQQGAAKMAVWALETPYDIYYQKVCRNVTSDLRYAFWIELRVPDVQ